VIILEFVMPVRGDWMSRNVATSLLPPTSVIRRKSHLVDNRKQKWNLVKQNND